MGNHNENHIGFCSKLRVKRVTKKKGGGEHLVMSGYLVLVHKGPRHSLSGGLNRAYTGGTKGRGGRGG